MPQFQGHKRMAGLYFQKQYYKQSLIPENELHSDAVFLVTLGVLCHLVIVSYNLKPSALSTTFLFLQMSFMFIFLLSVKKDMVYEKCKYNFNHEFGNQSLPINIPTV